MATEQMEHLADRLRSLAGPWTTERALQDSIGAVLRADAKREVWLTDSDRIDFLFGDIGIEVKTRGSHAELYLQCRRYVQTGQIAGLLVVTTRRTLAFNFVELIDEVPVAVLVVAGAF